MTKGPIVRQLFLKSRLPKVNSCFLAFVKMSRRLKAVSGDSAASFISTRPIKPVDAQSMDVARAWLADCSTNHVDCAVATQPPLPHRVIDVGSLLDNDQDRTVKLMQSEGQEGKYAALSYCWGGLQSYVLTLDNQKDMEKGLNLAEMPAGILSAIEVTRSLGLQYLCELQNLGIPRSKSCQCLTFSRKGLMPSALSKTVPVQRSPKYL